MFKALNGKTSTCATNSRCQESTAKDTVPVTNRSSNLPDWTQRYISILYQSYEKPVEINPTNSESIDNDPA